MALIPPIRRTRTVQNPYVQAARHAEMIGDFALARYKDAIQELSLKNVRGIPWLEPGDRVTVAESKTGVNAAFFVGRMQWSWAPGAIYAMSLDLMRVSDIFASEDYFVIGTDKYGSGTGHSHLFW